MTTENERPLNESTIERYVKETLGTIPGISSPHDSFRIGKEDGVVTITYLFAKYASPGGENPKTVFCAQYDPEHGEIFDDFNLTVADDHRGKGVGRRIVLEGIESLVRRSGVPLRGSTPLSAHGFWKALGYNIQRHGDHYGLEKIDPDGTHIAVLGEPYGESVDPAIEALSREELLKLLGRD